jgi:hypothetical protein
MFSTNLTQIARSAGDPRILHTGQSSLTGADRMARTLGWVSVGFGVAGLVAPRWIARRLGFGDRDGLVRFFGVRELASAVTTLSLDKPVGLASRLAGDAFDLATLTSALDRNNPKRDNAAAAMAMVVGITMLDLVAYTSVKLAHRRTPRSRQDYSDRSGLPRGASTSRGLARKDFRSPPDYRAEGTVASVLPAA